MKGLKKIELLEKSESSICINLSKLNFLTECLNIYASAPMTATVGFPIYSW